MRSRHCELWKHNNGFMRSTVQWVRCSANCGRVHDSREKTSFARTMITACPIWCEAQSNSNMQEDLYIRETSFFYIERPGTLHRESRHLFKKGPYIYIYRQIDQISLFKETRYTARPDLQLDQIYCQTRFTARPDLQLYQIYSQTRFIARPDFFIQRDQVRCLRDQVPSYRESSPQYCCNSRVLRKRADTMSSGALMYSVI